MFNITIMRIQFSAAHLKLLQYEKFSSWFNTWSGFRNWNFPLSLSLNWNILEYILQTSYEKQVMNIF